MRIAHTSDWQLGFKSGTKTDASGRNLRELDVIDQVRRTVDAIIEQEPDLVLIAGDVFHSARPSNAVICDAQGVLARPFHSLRVGPIVVVAGNHDDPRTTDTVSPVRLLGGMCTIIADRMARFATYDDCDILAVPDTYVARDAELQARGTAKYHLMVMHRGIQGVIPGHDRTGKHLAPDALDPRWDLIALGDYHVQHQVRPNAWYCGAPDYATSNVWGELIDEQARGIDGKGFMMHDLEKGTHTFHHVANPITHHDLHIDGMQRTAKQLGVDIGDALAMVPDPEHAIVRVTLTSALRQGALHIAGSLKFRQFRLNPIYTKRATTDLQAMLSKPRAERPTLDATVKAELDQRALPAGMDRERFTSTALQYLADALDQ